MLIDGNEEEGGKHIIGSGYFLPNNFGMNSLTLDVTGQTQLLDLAWPNWVWTSRLRFILLHLLALTGTLGDIMCHH